MERNLALLLSFIFFLILMYYLTKKHEGFMDLDYSRVYPGIFASDNLRYGSYWYIPAHEYLDAWMNGIPKPTYHDNIRCIVPPALSEKCMANMIVH